jgi:hypothetical protein
VNAIESRHLEVEEQDIGIRICHQSERVLTRSGFATDLEIRLCFEHGNEAVADDRMVIRDADADARATVHVPLR